MDWKKLKEAEKSKLGWILKDLGNFCFTTDDGSNLNAKTNEVGESLFESVLSVMSLDDNTISDLVGKSGMESSGGQQDAGCGPQCREEQLEPFSKSDSTLEMSCTQSQPSGK